MDSLWLSVPMGSDNPWPQVSGWECPFCVLVLRLKLVASVRILAVPPRASLAPRSKCGLYVYVFDSSFSVNS